MTNLPTPLTPADCDLRDFQYMELDVARLRDSKFVSTPNAEAFRAGVLLWCAAWHQLPAASLPDDDIELANLAGYGRMPVSIREWRKVREEALAGFVKCSDGRLYHSVIAEKALQAFEKKGDYAFKKFKDRLRHENKDRKAAGKPEFGTPTREQWNSGAYPHGIPPDSERIPMENAPTSEGVPAENALRGRREEQNGTEQSRTETLISVPDGTGGAAAKPAADLTKQELWTVGKSLLAEQGMAKAQCGSFVGKLVSDYGDAVVVEAVRTTVVARPADAAEYLRACCMRAAGQRAAPGQGNRQEALEQRNRQVADDWAGQGAPNAKP